MLFLSVRNLVMDNLEQPFLKVSRSDINLFHYYLPSSSSNHLSSFNSTSSSFRGINVKTEDAVGKLEEWSGGPSRGNFFEHPSAIKAATDPSPMATPTGTTRKRSDAERPDEPLTSEKRQKADDLPSTKSASSYSKEKFYIVKPDLQSSAKLYGPMNVDNCHKSSVLPSSSGGVHIPPNRPKDPILRKDSKLRRMILIGSSSNSIIQYLKDEYSWTSEHYSGRILRDGQGEILDVCPTRGEIFLRAGIFRQKHGNLLLNYDYFTIPELVIQYLEYTLDIPESLRREVSWLSEGRRRRTPVVKLEPK